MSFTILSISKNKSALIIGVSVLLVFTSSFLVFHSNFLNKDVVLLEDSDEVAMEQTLSLLDDKNNLINDLQSKLIEYDALIIENQALRDSLTLKKDSIFVLLNQLNGFESNESNFTKIRREYYALKAEIDKETADTLRIESIDEPVKIIVVTKVKKLGSTTKKPATKIATNVKKETATTFDSNSMDVEKIIKKRNSKKLHIIQLSATTFESKNGRLKPTKSSKKVDKIEITFTIDKNFESEIENKKFYIQILDVSNQLVGVNNDVFVGGKKLNYSFETVTAFFRTEKVSTDLFDLDGKLLQKGVYFMNIFDGNGELLVSKSFDLS